MLIFAGDLKYLLFGGIACASAAVRGRKLRTGSVAKARTSARTRRADFRPSPQPELTPTVFLFAKDEILISCQYDSPKIDKQVTQPLSSGKMFF